MFVDNLTWREQRDASADDAGDEVDDERDAGDDRRDAQHSTDAPRPREPGAVASGLAREESGTLDRPAGVNGLQRKRWNRRAVSSGPRSPSTFRRCRRPLRFMPADPTSRAYRAVKPPALLSYTLRTFGSCLGSLLSTASLSRCTTTTTRRRTSTRFMASIKLRS